jgi:hypothetical protein
MLIQAIEISVFKIRGHRLRALRWLFPKHADMHTIAAARRAAD